MGYEDIAGVYDRLHTRPIDLAENEFIFSHWLRPKLQMADTILDLGCGTGLLLEHLPWPYALYRGVDDSASMIAGAMFKHPGYAFAQEDACNLPEAWSQSFDVAVAAFGSFCHFQDRWGALEGIRKVLQPGGKLFLQLYSHHYANRPSACWNQVPDMAYVLGETAFYGRKKIKRLLEAQGFHVKRIAGFRLLTDEEIGEHGPTDSADLLRFYRREFLWSRFVPDKCYWLLVEASVA